MQQRMSADQEKRTQSNQEMLMRQMSAMADMKEGFLLKMVEKKDVDPLDQLLKLKQISDLLGGGIPDKDGWDRAAEVLGPIAKDIGPGLMGLLQQRGQPGQPQGAGPRFQPGTVAAVDVPNTPALGPPRAPKPAAPGTPGKPKVPKRPVAQQANGKPAAQVPTQAGPEGTAGGHFPGPETAPASPAPFAGTAAVETVVEALPVPAPPTPTGGWAPEFPSDAMTDLQDRIKFLVFQIEQALQNDWTAEQIFAGVVAKYPEDVLVAIRLVTPKKAMEMVAELVPDDWRLKTFRGKRRTPWSGSTDLMGSRRCR